MTDLDESGDIRRYRMTLSDITERKKAEDDQRKSEERFGALVEASSEVLYRMSPDWSEMRQLHSLGFLADTESPSRDWLHKYIHPDDRPHVTSVIREAIGNKSVFELEHRVRRQDGSWGWTFSRAIPMLDENGEIAEWFGAASDITERKMAEEALLKLNNTLEQQVAERTAVAEKRTSQLRRLALELSETEERERKQVALILHDDLQQYLAALRFQLQMHMSDKTDVQTIGNLIQLVDESIRKCRSLSHELSPPVLHQNGLLAALNWLVSDMREKHGLKVRFACRPEAEPESPALASMLFRSIRELLFNAVKHSGAGSATVEAKKCGDRILVRVKDEGKGFDPAATETKGGMMNGFGLFAIRERVDSMGGRFEIDSAPGKGCSVTLEAPTEALLKSEPPETKEAEAVLKETEACAPNEGRNIRILVADDHAVVRQGLSKLLATEPDIEVVGQAADGAEAVRLVSELAPDVVLMDVTMPNMDGVEATMRIVRANPNIRVVGLSMHDNPATQEKMTSAGAAAYLYKASPVEKILEAIRSGHL